MSPSHLLRAHLAPSNPLETIFADQAVLASEEMASLSSRRPEAPDARWLRHYSQAQALFRRALSDLEKLRKASPPPAEATPRPATAPIPAAPPACPVHTHAPIPAPFRRPSPFSTLPHVSATPPSSPDQAPVASPPSDIPWPKPRDRHERRRLDALKRTAGPRLRKPTPAPPA
jgi:hypothetical protein